ncbi:MAG: helix-turn-helix domain-containing protein, partial [Lachnospiraceae bacterium]
MSIETKELINRILQEKDISTYLEKYENELITISPAELLNTYISQKDMKVSEVAKASGQGEYVYKVFNGERKPSRDILIAISFGLKLSMDEVQLLLRVFGYAMLDPRNKKDSIIIYSIKSKKSVEELNDLLFDNNE